MSLELIRFLSSSLAVSNMYVLRPLKDTVWIAEHLNSDAVLGHTSLSAFDALEIPYGGHLPTLKVQKIAVNYPGFTDCAPESCFPTKPVEAICTPSCSNLMMTKSFIKVDLLKLEKFTMEESSFCGT